jgi:hypothetical protein
VPSLLSLCLKFVDESILNLDNGPFVYDFARSNGFSTLEARAAKFCTESYRGLRAKHGPEALLESLGTEMFVALETNHNTVEAQRQRISRMGTVLPDGIAPPVQPVRPPQPSPSMTAASAMARAAPAIAPSAAAPSLTNASMPRSIFGGGGEKCAVCFKTVYQAERTLADGRPFHHACFRCVTCACKLTLSSFERIEDGRLYCKAHFMQQWLERSSGAATQLGAPIPAVPGTSSADGQGGAATSSSSAAGGDLLEIGSAGGDLLEIGSAGGDLLEIGPAGGDLLEIGPAGMRMDSRRAHTQGMNLGMNLGGGSNPSSGSAAPAGVPAPPPMLRIGPTFHAPVAPSVGSWVASQTVCCERCGKKVYANERQDAMAHRSRRLLVFHKACFRCIDCNTLLRGNNFELFLADDAAEGSEALCCRTHFMARRSLPSNAPAAAPTG